MPRRRTFPILLLLISTSVLACAAGQDPGRIVPDRTAIVSTTRAALTDGGVDAGAHLVADPGRL